MSAMTLEQVVRVIDDEIAALPTMAAMAASGIPTSCDPRPAIERLSAARDAIEAIRARGESVAWLRDGMSAMTLEQLLDDLLATGSFPNRAEWIESVRNAIRARASLCDALAAMLKTSRQIRGGQISDAKSRAEDLARAALNAALKEPQS